MDLEDLEPRKQPAKPRNLASLSIEELTDYIAALEAEIVRVRNAIDAKKAHLAGASAFFRKD